MPNHSHACGINHDDMVDASSTAESFPRMWDQHHPGRQFPGGGRIIPTHVGSTGRNYGQRTGIANHSHACGINNRQRNSLFYGDESFPRMWDQRRSCCFWHSALRIIPTHVGSTHFRQSEAVNPPNHSHACGINLR